MQAASNLIDLQEDDLFRARFVPCPSESTVSLIIDDLGATVTTSQVPYIDSVAWHLDGDWVSNGLYFEPEFGGFYSATVYFSGCSVTSDALWVGAVDLLEIPSANSEISIRPNPAQSSVEISSSAGPLRVFNALGQLHAMLTESERNDTGRHMWRLSVSDWPVGIYWLRAGQATGTLVVE